MTHPTPEYVELIERLRATRVSNYVGETGYGGPKRVLMNSDGPAAADALEAQSRAYVALAERVREMEAALVYVRENLGNPVPIGRRHVARRVDAALAQSTREQEGK